MGTSVQEHPDAPLLEPAEQQKAARSLQRLQQQAQKAREQLLIVTVAFLGLVIMLYPSTASWVNDIYQRNHLQGYMTSQNAMTQAQKDAELASAEQYNENLHGGLIVDPFSNTSADGNATIDADAQAYLNELSFDPDGVMSEVTVPSVGIDLPVYHGATEETLRKGAGHLYGSSLPVGGSSTHAVLTGHSGLPESSLFTKLKDTQVGDVFYVTTLGRVMAYRVTALRTVLPTEIQTLQVQPGKDLVTLVTCTPIGVNTHRLLVEGERIPLDQAGDQPVTPSPLGFPWWALAIVPVFAYWVFCLVRVIRLRRRVQARLKPQS